jgi:quercetin dioxygenase-like cupin family protein
MHRPSRQVHFAGPIGGALRLENRHTGEVLIMRRVRHGDQVVLQLEGSVPPKGEGPPLHVHLVEREEGEVVAGVMSAVVGGAAIKVRVGESAVFPVGVPHRWWNAEDQSLQTRGRVVPVVDLDRFLQGIFAVANAGQAGRMPLFYVAHVMYRHRRTQRLAAIPLARVVFPALVFVGWLLGKYRGDGWPGAPESCPGALEAQT